MVMAFDRKWVSDSNLDKLWNDTLEKKEANKQRRSPDFCKDAILSATLKKISSEMSMRRFSSPMIDVDINSDDDSDEDDENIIVLTNVPVPMKTNSVKNALRECITKGKNVEKTYTELTVPVPESLCAVNEMCSNDSGNELKTSENSQHMETAEVTPPTNIGSPKRKRKDSDDDDLKMPSTEIVSNRCSPSKRQRFRNGVRSRTNSRSVSPRWNRRRSQSPAHRSSSIENLNNDSHNLPNLPKLKHIPSDDESSLLPPPLINSALLSPVKSMVNSISELSIGVKEQWLPSEGGSWSVPVAAASHSDPLELDGFFNNLKKVTS